MEEQKILSMKDQIRRRVEEGNDPDTAAELVMRELSALGLTDVEEIVRVALGRYREEINKQEFLPVASIPRRRHVGWYGGPSSTGIWAGLKRYLVEAKGWDPETTVKSIDQASTKIVSLLDAPGTPAFSTRGLVVGYVQSGKTANITAVMAKAVDANYKFVIVLAGMTDALRSQTQERIEKDLVSQDRERWHPWTSVENDFSISPDQGFPGLNPSDRHLAVVKKNKFVLERFLKMLDNTPEQRLRNISFLIIDDECDQASVNAARYRQQMTAINKLVRQILHKSPKSAYIGYTATPFANVLIDPAVSVDPNKPDDLYPRDFVVALPRPEGYFGAESLFGRGLLDADEEIPDAEGLDMIRIVEDDETDSLRPGGPQDRENFSLAITPSLDESIRYYILATAARCARGQVEQHSSMLIHTTVYVAPHFDAQTRIGSHVEQIAKSLVAKDAVLYRELRELWEREKEKVDPLLFGNPEVTFEGLSQYLNEVAGSIDVVVENGVSEARLDFSEGSGKRYIVVGGSVLARGLTIEGLIVSFFLRTSSQYDSLMQMGRWFGYRPGYEDLPRVWMTRDMRDAFKELATVEAEIRNDIDVYHLEENMTPLDFAVRIRQIPGMSITAKNKMLSAETCNISYSGEHIQTTRFKHKSDQWLEGNWNGGAKLIDDAMSQIGAARTVDRGRLFEGVPVGSIKRFLAEYQTHDSHRDFQSGKIIEYIDAQNEKNDAYLGYWNVGIVEPGRGEPSESPLGALGNVKTVVRSLLWETKDKDADIKALMSRGDILIDLPSNDPVGNDGWGKLKKRRVAANVKRPLLLLYAIESESKPRQGDAGKKGKSPTREPLNAVRDVLAVGIVFPESPSTIPENYVRVTLPPREYEEPELQELEDEEAA